MQVRAAEIVADAQPSRPELPSGPADAAEYEEAFVRLAEWHEQQWAKLRDTKELGAFTDDEHFGCPS
jgi:hypothetical protein